MLWTAITSLPRLTVSTQGKAPARVVNPIPKPMLATYWPTWSGPVPISSIPDYNTVLLAFATPVERVGAVAFEQNRESRSTFMSDIQSVRSNGRAVLLAVGGAGGYFTLASTSEANNFIASVESILENVTGPIDGIDWDIEGGALYPAQMIYIAEVLKTKYPGFQFTLPPAPWNSTQMTVATRLCQSGALDVCSPQFYGLTGLTTDEQRIGNAVSRMEDNWIPSMGGDASKTGLGFGLLPRSTGETMTLSGMLTVWRALVQNYPSLRGVFSWDVSRDQSNNYQFAAKMANVIA